MLASRLLGGVGGGGEGRHCMCNSFKCLPTKVEACLFPLVSELLLFDHEETVSQLKVTITAQNNGRYICVANCWPGGFSSRFMRRRARGSNQPRHTLKTVVRFVDTSWSHTSLSSSPLAPPPHTQTRPLANTTRLN